jgi:hypothetical protein
MEAHTASQLLLAIHKRGAFSMSLGYRFSADSVSRALCKIGHPLGLRGRIGVSHPDPVPESHSVRMSTRDPALGDFG